MTARTRRSFAAFVALALVFAACGNSDDDDAATPTTAAPDDTATTAGGDDGGETTTTAGDDAGGGDRDTFVAIEGVPGVTDEAINYAVIGTRAGNPLGTCILDCYLAGIEAYFAFRNDEGGIYGRQLTVSEVIDDELANNQARALEVISDDSIFGNFNATLLASGWADLDDAGVPTYVWGINLEEEDGRQNIFPSLAVPCPNCVGRTVPYIASLAGATNAASLGYGVTENSRVCAQTTGTSFEQYEADTGVHFAYLNDELDFGLPNGIGPEVTAMRDAGVDFISTCMDLNGMKTLAQELDRQGMQDVVLYHPNTYNQQFVAEADPLFEGDYVGVQFRPFEAEGPGTSDFLEWMANTGQEPSELAMVGWINASAAFEGLLAAGPEFDRQSVLDATNTITDFSAGGAIQPIDWSRQHDAPSPGDLTHDYLQECAAVVQVVDGAFQTVAPPDTPWLCWDAATDEMTEPTPTNFE